MTVLAPFPAACVMVPPSATTGEEIEEEGNDDESDENAGGGSGGCWVLVAGVRAEAPPLSFQNYPPREDAVGDDSRRVPGSRDGQVRSKGDKLRF